MSDYTSFLVSIPSFVEGMARVLDIGGTLDAYNESETPEEADLRALKNDFLAIGEDFNIAIENERENSNVEITCE